MTKLSLKRPLTKVVKKISNTLRGNGIINFKERGKINLIDVGSLGNLPEPWLSNACNIRNLLSFEPLEGARRRNNVIISSCALWSENCRRDFYIYKGFRSSGSSLFEQNFEFVEANFSRLKNTGPKDLAETWKERSQLINKIDTECRSLDSVLEELKLPFTFDFLKIDAQGAEYEILRGAEDFLKNDCTGLHLELFNIPLYKGIKLMPEVTEYLDRLGFSLVKKMPFHGTFNSQNDCIFLKRGVAGGKTDVKELIAEIYRLSPGR